MAGYKKIIEVLENFEEKVFQSVFVRVKDKLEILDENFQKSMSLHMLDEKN